MSVCVTELLCYTREKHWKSTPFQKKVKTTTKNRNKNTNRLCYTEFKENPDPSSSRDKLYIYKLPSKAVQFYFAFQPLSFCNHPFYRYLTNVSYHGAMRAKPLHFLFLKKNTPGDKEQRFAWSAELFALHVAHLEE